jgi:hypothetical protein
MDLFGLLLVTGALLILLLLAMLVLESLLKLRLAWKFRKAVDSACMYPECITRPRPERRE